MWTKERNKWILWLPGQKKAFNSLPGLQYHAAVPYHLSIILLLKYGDKRERTVKNSPKKTYLQWSEYGQSVSLYGATSTQLVGLPFSIWNATSAWISYKDANKPLPWPRGVWWLLKYSCMNIALATVCFLCPTEKLSVSHIKGLFQRGTVEIRQMPPVYSRVFVCVWVDGWGWMGLQNLWTIKNDP